MKDYYEILGVEAEASEEEIRACWIELTKRYHPDLGETEDGDLRIREINEAYEILKDEPARFHYDFERDLKRSFVKKAHREQERRMHIRKLFIIPCSGVLVLLLIVGFFLLRSGRVPAPQETEALRKNDKGSEKMIALQVPPARTDSKAQEVTRAPGKMNEGVTPPERKKEIAPQGGQEMASLSLLQSPAVAELPSPPPARKESEANEKLARQVVTRPEIPAVEGVSREVPGETQKRFAEELPKETPKQVAKEVPKVIPKEIPKEAPKEVAEEVVKETPKEVTKEVQKEVSKEVPKETPKLVAREIPEEVQKEIPKEVAREVPKVIPKEIPKEAPQQIAREVVREVPKEMPKTPPREVPREVPREIPREVSKEVPKEVPPETALVTLHPGEKMTMWAKEQKTEKTVVFRPSLLAKEEEVKQFFDNYVDRYRQKDARGFLSFFSAKAVQNQTEGFEAIRSSYTKWIDQSEELRYQIEGIKIEIYQQRVDVKARFRIDQKLKKDGAEKVWKGNIRWVLVKEGGRLKIRSLDYQNEKSP